MATSAIHFYQTAETRRSLANIFKSVEELERNHKRQVAFIYDEMDLRADRKQRLARVLNILKTYSVCEAQGYLGVCFLSIATIMETYIERYGKISIRCVKGIMADLRELGFIQRVETKRMTDNRQSTNIYRTKPFRTELEEPTPTQGCEDSEGGSVDGADKPVDNRTGVLVEEELAPKGETKLHPKKAHFFSKAQFKVLRERNTTTLQRNGAKTLEEGSKSAKLLNFVPKSFRSAFSAITATAREIYEFWRITRHCVKDRNFDEKTTEETYQAAFRRFFECCKAATKGKFEMRNPFGFYHSIMAEESWKAYYCEREPIEQFRRLLERDA